ncbi:hypothetical protein ACQKIE_01030 [Luteibacter sp. NPDC031894]|uniref:hypothetical protein n=1 Tax=Luteibacter sp. NPDC031894 TaxID=3390572 RepID=UPI003D011063
MSTVTPENISPLALLMVIGSLGSRISAVDGKLFVTRRRELPPAVIEAIARHKAELISMAEVRA